MPFIWDDNQYHFVDDEDEYDKNRFVVVRKLFITLNKDEAKLPVSVFPLLHRNLRKTKMIWNILYS